MTGARRRGLILMGGYWPGHEATGPNQSLRQMCAQLRDEWEFRIVARDRPFGAHEPLARTGAWIEDEIGLVRYTTVSSRGPHGLDDILRDTPHDLLWLNGFHDREFTLSALALRRLGRIARTPTLLSPRGELAGAALRLKSPRKAAYRRIAQVTGLLSDVWLHATSEHEARDIKAWAPWARGVLLAPNVRAMIDAPAHIAAPPGRIRLVFVGRISKIKNLDLALTALGELSLPVDFDIFGPVEDEAYWRVCRAIIASLPAHIRVRQHGAVANADIAHAMGAGDLFFLPTGGENFGHAIFEALACRVPVLISDRTPWRNLEALNAGWDLPLDMPRRFAQMIERFAGFSEEERERLRGGARALAERFVAESGAVGATLTMLDRVAADVGSLARSRRSA